MKSFTSDSEELAPLNEALRTYALSIGVAAAEVKKTGGARLPACRTIGIFNNSANTIYFGEDNTVTTATGFPIAAGAQQILDAGAGVAIWLIAGVAANDVRICELG